MSKKSAPFFQYKNGYIQRTPAYEHEENERGALKQKMLEREALSKNQVCELHRFDDIQRNMMEEVKQKDLHKWRPSTEPVSSSSCLRGPQLQLETAKWNTAGSPQWNSVKCKTSCSKEELAGVNIRPLKVRKIFNLRFPANDIDIEEEESVRESSGPGYSTKQFLVDHSGLGADSLRDVSGSAPYLVDLNAPIKVEESSALPVNFLDLTSDDTESNSFCQLTESKAAPFGMFGESIHWSNGFNSNIHKQEQLPNAYESGFWMNEDRVHRSCNIKEEGRWGERMVHNIDFSARNSDRFYNGYSASIITAYSPFSSSFPSLQTPCMHSLASTSNGFGHFNSAGVTNPVIRGQDSFAHKLFLNTSSSGFHSGSSEQRFNFQKSGFDCHNITRLSNAPLDFLQASDHQDAKSVSMAIDLNKEAQSSSSDDVVILEDLNVPTRKIEPQEQHKPAMSWLLKSKPICIASPDKSCCRSEADELSKGRAVDGVEITSDNKIVGLSVSHRHTRETELPSVPSTSASLDERKSSSYRGKIRMIDINVACDPNEDVTAEEPEASTSVKKYIDLNSCTSDCEDLLDPYNESKSSSNRKMLQIDLEAPYLSKSEEFSLLTEETEHFDQLHRDEAELILAILKSPEDICSNSEARLAESLLLIADAILESETGIHDTTSKGSSVDKVDEFEAMTLQLEETEQQNYLPNTHFLVDGSAAVNVSMNKSGRGQSRRGRPRRDFQRDILPGLTTLSRHEVTEDLQLFGGLMRAMGHCWSPGLTRRNGGRTRAQRGRKRTIVETIIPPPPHNVNYVATPLIQHLSKMESGSEDRSLTGWGKTMRRLRRHRCSSQGCPSAM